MQLKNFGQFINESEQPSELKKMTIAVNTDMVDNRFLHEKDWMAPQTWQIVTQKNRNITEGHPLLNYSNFHTKRLLKEGQIKPDQIYNAESEKKKVSSKKEFYKLHEKSGYLPKSVIKGGDISSLKYPIVAKPENRYGGLGITIFENEEEMGKADLSSFDLFSEKIPIDEEYRMFMWKDQPLGLYRRIPANEKTKSLKKGTDEKLKFNYEFHENPNYEEYGKMVKHFAESHSGLPFYSLDFVKSDGKIKVIEMSSEPGPSFGIIHKVYEKMYEDHFGKPLPESDKELLRSYQQKDIEATLASDKKRYSVKK